MKNLKVIGVLIFSFVFFGLNVNALEIDSDYKLSDNSTEPIIVKENSNVVIDLNGKKLNTSDVDAITINDGATVVITGDGSVESEKASIFNKGGNVTVENGTFYTTKWYTVKNLGTMTINGGSFSQDNTEWNSSLIANGWYGGGNVNDRGVAEPSKGTTVAKAIMTINGGTFTHLTTTSTIKSDDWSKTTINDGKFVSENGKLIQATGEVIIKNGEFVGYKSIAVFNGNGVIGYEPALLTINGGKFNTKYIIQTDTEGTLTITGGKFSGVEKFTDPSKTNDFKKYITGGTFSIDVAMYLDSAVAKTIKENEGYVVYTKQTVRSKGDEKGTIIFNKEEAFPGETITFDIIPSKGYLLESFKITDIFGKSLEVKDNKFIMPKDGVDVDAVFVAEKKINEASISDDTNIVVDNGDEIKEILLESLKQLKKYDDESISLQIVVEDIKVDDETTKDFENTLENNEINNGKIVSYFDISIAIKNSITNEQLGNLTELTKKIKFSIAVPEGLENVNEGYIRNFYIIKKHGDKTTIINGTLSKDDKYIEFETDEFSTYALAYEDVLSSDDVVSTEVVPQTFDGIGNILIFGTLAVISMAGITIYFKRELDRK